MNINENENNGCEISNHNSEKAFINELCEIIVDALDISYKDRTVTSALFRKILDNKLNSRSKGFEGLLQQYETYILNRSSERLISDLDLGDVKINHNYATHAKLSDIVKKIKELYNIKDK